ncbi:GNAT family N-acetyltransferase [Streptomyces sp. MBT56]|uniref:GNAT family N-acetyltransferase n=1 Tax=unclassified Streptomyces TaxID=2593676 RepID=UPI00190E1ABA|nr:MULTISPECIES: GNAT family N-acetyltransferase [unclassified Streptomyces]MBK3557424.1 GNAT family N-acetyltransferase [Streptomyces sp. MBT56]MBK3604766.1 GNAT family N-acetyltransferase [Streptomyces sp. MBT54]MBK3618126.1 GNAT family N-acetyltransferase [Streptomyces sp. MBT98]MBK6046224.1 GNAT family N-acetyltransferase [Streptomyces sp. MBT55]
MPMDPLVSRARVLWQELAAAPGAAFGTPGRPTVLVAPDSALAPPSWVGVVAVGDAALITAPTDRAANSVRSGLTVAALTDPVTVARLLPVADTLGPAVLGYLAPDALRPVGRTAAPTTCLSPEHASLRALLAEAGPSDAGESGLADVTSPVFVVRDGTEVLAAAGYEHLTRDTAHLCVLTAPDARGRGLARQVAHAATAHALAAGLLPQWRARPPASRRVARALGYREVGRQLSVRPA